MQSDSGKHKLELLIPPPVIAIATGILMYLIDLYVPIAISLPGGRILFIVFTVLGLGTAMTGVLQFRRARTTIHPVNPHETTQLVTHGVYRFSRNPMYLGVSIVLVGWACFLGNMIPIAMVCVFVAYINRFQIIPEERILKSKFNDEFTQYVSSVRRWL